MHLNQNRACAIERPTVFRSGRRCTSSPVLVNIEESKKMAKYRISVERLARPAPHNIPPFYEWRIAKAIEDDRTICVGEGPTDDEALADLYAHLRLRSLHEP